MSDFQSCPKARCPGGGVIPSGAGASGTVECNHCGECFPVSTATTALPQALTGSGGGGGGGGGRGWIPFFGLSSPRDVPIKPCPACSTPIERAVGGCDNIRCLRCGCHFCWWCGGIGTRTTSATGDGSGKRISGCQCSGLQSTQQQFTDLAREIGYGWICRMLLIAALIVYGVWKSWFVMEAATDVLRQLLLIVFVDLATALGYSLIWFVAVLFFFTQSVTETTPGTNCCHSIWAGVHRVLFTAIAISLVVGWFAVHSAAVIDSQLLVAVDESLGLGWASNLSQSAPYRLAFSSILWTHAMWSYYRRCSSAGQHSD